MPRTRLLPLLFAVWSLAVLLVFHFGPVSEPFPPGNLPRLILDLVLVASIAAGAWGLGAALLKPLLPKTTDPAEAACLEIGAGLGALALSVLGLAAAGLLYRGAVIAIVAAGAGLLLTRRSRSPAPAGDTMPRSRRPWSRSETALAGAVVLAGAVTLPAALAPPEFYDALIYHLAVPDLYVRHHGVVAVPGNYYAHFPANMGMLYAAGLLLGRPESAQALHWLCGALAVGSLFVFSSRWTDRPTALLSCALLALTPGIMLISVYAIADLAVVLFATLCFGCVIRRWEEPDARWAALAGLFAGLAAGTKYTAIPVVCLPAVLGVLFAPSGEEGSRRRAARDAMLLAAVAVLAVTPWMGRNLAVAGNPVAPYFSSAEASGSPDLSDDLQRRLPEDAGMGARLLHYAAAPWNASMRRQGAGGYLGPVYLILVPMLLFLRGTPRVIPAAALLLCAGLAGWALTVQVGRYLMPVLPLAALLAAVAARRLPRAITIPAVGWSLLFGLFLFSFLTETIGAYRVVTGAESRESYLSRRVSYFPAVRYLASVEPEARVLFVGEGRGFYCPRAYLASTPFDRPAIETYAGQGDGEPDLLRALRGDGITHLLVSGPELRRTKGIGADDLMRRYFPSGSPVLLFEAADVRVYALPAVDPRSGETG